MGLGARAGFHAWNPMSISAPGRSGTPGITISELPTLGQGTGRAWPGKGAGVPYHGVSHCGPRGQGMWTRQKQRPCTPKGPSLRPS